MFRNKNYEWMLNFDMYEDKFFGSIYWMYLYAKLMHQGDDKDRYELEEIYNSRGQNVPFPFCILTSIFGFGDRYKETCKEFIQKTIRAYYDDNIERDNNTKMDNLAKEREELERKANLHSFGYVRKELQEEAEIEEMRLDSIHTEKQKTFKHDPKNPKLVIKSGVGTYLRAGVQILRQDDVVINQHGGTTTVVHGVVFDMYNGFYACAIYCDNDKDENGLPHVTTFHSRRYADVSYETFSGYRGRVQGIISMYMETLAQSKRWATIDGGLAFLRNLEQKVEALEEAKRSKKSTKNTTKVSAKKDVEPDVNIDKINKALGITDTDEDLNGDIF